ncbi:MAG: Two-component regulatory system protein containing hybrid kinase and response regulator domain [Betaproteobacteria bacterium]|nr:Two-component regulatory system protein containing hybrid kinase and response regulator domain [Betaproteobacteria bacterium]
MLSRSGRLSIAAAGLVAAFALLGTLAGIDALARFIPGWPSVRVPTGIATLGVAAAFGLLLSGRRGAGQLLLAVLAVAVLMAMLLPEARRLPGGALQTYPGAALLLIIAAAAFVSAPGEKLLAASRVLAAASATLLFIALIGISFRLLLDLPPLVDVSLPSLIALLLLTYAVAVVRPDTWLIERLTSQRAGAVMTRRLLPAVLLLPLVIGWLEVAGEGSGALDSAFGSVLQTVVTMFALGAIVLWGARRLDKLDLRRSEAEQQAHAQREWLHVTIASCGEAVVATDPTGVVRLVNPAAEALAGRASSELVGRPISEAYALAADEGGMEHPLLTVLRGAQYDNPARELKLLGPGLDRYVEVNVAPITSADQALLGGVMVVRDVSLRRQNEQALRHAYSELDRRVAERTAELERANAALHESLALLRGVTESTPDLIIVKDGSGRVVMANPAQVKAIGKPESEIVGHTEREFVGDDEHTARIMENDRRVMSSGRIERIEEAMTGPEGARTFLSTKSPLRDVRGNVIGVIGVATDISERKRMENELREAQRFTQGLVETAPIVLYLFDHVQQRIVYATGMGLEALGYTSADLMALDRAELERLVHPDDIPGVIEHLRREPYEQTGMREVEFRVRTHAGEWRWMHGRERPFEPGVQNRLLLGVTVDITDRKIAELEREHLVATEQRLRLEAERANRAKDEFLAIVSHELRSPLNALRGWGFLLGSAKTPDQALIDRATQAIKRNVDHQARLIDDLLDTSRIMSGKLNIERRPVNLVDVVQGAIEVIRASAAAKRIGVEFNPAQPVVTIDGDAARLHQIAVNLLSNAVKFTPEAGQVTVSVSTDDAVRLSVADTGAGIDGEFLPRVFDRFSQADTSTTRRHGGLGIGLALVRHLSELHGGKVSAASEGAGKGSTFTVELPLPQAEAPPAVAPSADRPRAVGGLADITIFTLDDDPDARDVISLTLRQAGAQVRSVATGAELIALLEKHLPDDAPDILLLDLAMPDEDGFTVLARVRALEARKRVAPDASLPAIAVTAFTEVSRARVIEQGFSDHVSKPIDPARLVASIRRALSAERAET